MKAFVFVLLCALVAVQGRYTGLQSTRSAAALGENPWVVHLRIAVSTSGLLNSCAGSLIDNRWVLTSASCISDARFIWVRYGTVNVINPTLVTENSLVRIDPSNKLGLININRFVESTENISPISLVGTVAKSSNFCAYGGEEQPGEVLNCFDVDVAEEDGVLTVSSKEVVATQYDLGGSLVSNGAQVAVLVGAGSDGSVGDFVKTADYLEWIEQETGIVLTPEAVPEVAPEAVRFVQ